MIDYKYREDELLEELKQYIDATYGEHYSQNKFQATEFIIDGGHGMGFCIGNILKYAQRYGKKDGFNRKDLTKVLHYAMIALYIHDEEHSNDVQSDSGSKDQNRRDRVRELSGHNHASMHSENKAQVQRLHDPRYEF